MNFRNISAWSIRNPVAPIVLFLGLTLAGLISFMRMEVQNNPDIEFPVVIASISQPGAAPTEIETQITQKVESAVRGIEGSRNISSYTNEGSSTTVVEFQIGTDVNNAVNEVKNAIDQIRGELPEGIMEPYIRKETTSGEPLAYFAVQASDMTMEQLSWFVDDTVSKRLMAVSGMGSVERSGGVDREIRVILDPVRMQSYGITAAQINNVLRQVNLNAAGGQAEIAGSRQSVRVLGNAADAHALSETQIPLSGGRAVKLGDVAKVTDGYSEQMRIGKISGKQVVSFSIARAKGASDLSVFDSANEVIAEIEKENPGVDIITMFNNVQYTEDQYHSSLAAMIEGAVLAVIVVFIFLRDWRATIISALAIPLSAIPTFWIMDLMGFTLNSLSLLALGLVAGVLVDDAIVEIENIVRHMRMGKSAYQAAIDAADEIGLAVVATTFSIVAVFLPVGLMPGVSGQFFKNFGLTVVASVLVSLAVARMITPMVAAYFLKSTGHATHGEGWLMDRYMSVLRWSLDSSKVRKDPNRGKFRHLIAYWRDHRVWVMGIGFLAFLATIFMLTALPTQFFPTVNQDSSSIRIEMVPGTTVRQTEAVADRVAKIIESQPETKLVMEAVREGNADLYINLREDRARTSMEYEREIGPQLAAIPDARVYFRSQGGGGGTGRALSLMLSGSNPDLLYETAQRLVDEMETMPEVVAPRINADMRRPELIITPRLDLAAELGVTTQALSQAIRIATIGDINQNTAKFSLSDRQVPIRVMLPESSRRDLSTIENLPVPTSSGGSVPLSRIAEIGFGSGPVTIQRHNQNRRILVGADLAPGALKGTAMEKILQGKVMTNLPAGVSNAPVGEDEWQAEMAQSFGIALGSGILLVFAVLVLLYKRFMSPLVNMGSLLLAPLGGLIALALIGQPLSLPVFIGILMLFGIVAKNSILLIDFALEELDKGVPKREAIIDAGHKRAQPIVMTTVAMVAGMIPTAISLTGDGAWRAPMGTVVIGGLILSTLLTLLIVPAAFSLADGVEKRVGPYLRRRILTYRGPEDHGPEPAPQPAE